jgi:hypothetical protein
VLVLDLWVSVEGREIEGGVEVAVVDEGDGMLR